MSKVDFIFIHGFLGVPHDWDDVVESVKLNLDSTSYEGVFHKLDFFNKPNLSPKNSFEKIGKEFVNFIKDNTENEKKILVGYSLGGRLALHIFEQNPNMFEKLVCVSAHPGLQPSQAEEMKERASRDLLWSELFLNHNWPELISKWNDQEVFQGSQSEPEREVSDYRRDLLAKSLTNWSLSKQSDKRPVIKEFFKKISFVVGEKDKKFVELYNQLSKEIPGIDVKIVHGSGHRVLFDNPDNLGNLISTFVLQ